MTTPDWSAMLAAEEARAMAGKPAFRVRMMARKGVACPRCGVAVGVQCKRPPSCRERVWAMRALQRSPAMSRPPMVADVAGFLDAIHGELIGVGTSLRRDPMRAMVAAPWLTPSLRNIEDSDMDSAIRHGLVRLSVASNGAPVWVITGAGAEYAEGWQR